MGKSKYTVSWICDVNIRNMRMGEDERCFLIS